MRRGSLSPLMTLLIVVLTLLAILIVLYSLGGKSMSLVNLFGGKIS